MAKGNILTRTVLKRSTWRDVGNGAIGGLFQGIGASIFGASLGSVAGAVGVGCIKMDSVCKTAIITNLITDAVAGLLAG